MKAKSIYAQIISFVLMMATKFSPVLTAYPKIIAWLSVVTIVTTWLLQQSIVTTGTLPQGWSTGWIVLMVLLLANQVFNALSSSHLIPVDLASYIVLGINIFIMSFLKDYGDGSLLVGKVRK